jgi:hypothetical protein
VAGLASGFILFKGRTQGSVDILGMEKGRTQGSVDILGMEKGRTQGSPLL